MRSLIYVLGILSAQAFANPAGVAPTQIGANGRPVGTTLQQLFQTMKANGLVRARWDVALTWDTDATAVSDFEQVVNAASANGIKIECILHTGFTWGDRTDHGIYPAADATALYNQGYNRVYNFVSQFSSQVTDWELGNEINLIARDANGNPFFGRGWTAAEFQQPIMYDWSHVLKGMSDAIDKVNAVKGTYLRRTVGTTSSMFGYIDFMLSQGVKVDVLGYHYYEHSGVDPYHYWRAVDPVFDLFAKMGSYKLPVHVNEINCAEIYDANFSNVAGSSTMQTCNDNLATMLKTFTSQSETNIENILIYEMLDEPAKAAPENQFGLLFNINSPKPMLATVASFAKASVPAPAPAEPSITFPSSNNVQVGVPVSIMPQIIGVSGNLQCQGVLLPVGLSMNYNTCVISGTPTAAPGIYVPTLIYLTLGSVQVVQFVVQE